MEENLTNKVYAILVVNSFSIFGIILVFIKHYKEK